MDVVFFIVILPNSSASSSNPFSTVTILLRFPLSFKCAMFTVVNDLAVSSLFGEDLIFRCVARGLSLAPHVSPAMDCAVQIMG